MAIGHVSLMACVIGLQQQLSGKELWISTERVNILRSFQPRSETCVGSNLG